MNTLIRDMNSSSFITLKIRAMFEFQNNKSLSLIVATKIVISFPSKLITKAEAEVGKQFFVIKN